VQLFTKENKFTAETLLSRLTCSVWVKHSLIVPKGLGSKKVWDSIYWTFSHVKSHLGVNISDVRPLKVNMWTQDISFGIVMGYGLHGWSSLKVNMFISCKLEFATMYISFDCPQIV
jgi:hypothetical protein